MKKLILVQPRGFCAGVIRAIETVRKALKTFGPPIYVFHPIVHNRHVLLNLEKEGAIFVESIDKIPRKSRLIYSAHGVPPKVRNEAALKELEVIDATCCLVEKLHRHAKNFAKRGFHIFFIGNSNHAEVKGIVGEAFEYITVIEGIEDVAKVSVCKEKKYAVITQTTLSQDKARDIIEALEKKFPSLDKSCLGICHATKDRQNGLIAIVPCVDLVIVIGDPKSSNSNSLKEIVQNHKNIPAYLVHEEKEILDEWFFRKNVVGMTAGASTPEYVVKRCVEKLENMGFAVEEMQFPEKELHFPLPKGFV